MGNIARFWHLSDLHLLPCAEQCAQCDCTEDACSIGIKAHLLKDLGTELKRNHTPPDMLFITGDILDGLPGQEGITAPFLDPLLQAARERGTEIYGILGTDGHDGPARKVLKGLDWGWLLETGEVRQHRSGLNVVAVSERTPEEVRKAVNNVRTPEGPSVLLAHTESVAAGLPFNYRALGHGHTAMVARYSDTRVSGRPGHLYSYWDGSGKAWPVFMIAGTISVPEGVVEAWRVPLESAPFKAPPTRQVYGDFGGFEASRGNLYLVHAPTERWFYDGCGLEPSAVDFLTSTGAVRATFRFTSKGHRDEILRAILTACPNDVFVSPATGKGNADRVHTWGRRLLEDELFDEFVLKSFKRMENTQTSDYLT